ncbi:MAG: hypothetical protein QM762_13815 [Chryseolinea sp.]
MTVVLYDNQNPGMKVATDTLVKDSVISLSKSTIDIYYCSDQFHIPYYLPTGGIYKDSIKEKECDMSIYPRNVKCYMYDEQNRVTTMSVNGSGTMGDWNYKYDSKDRIINIEWMGHNYEIKYNDLGLLTELIEESGDLKTRIKIGYR